MKIHEHPSITHCNDTGYPPRPYAGIIEETESMVEITADKYAEILRRRRVEAHDIHNHRSRPPQGAGHYRD